MNIPSEVRLGRPEDLDPGTYRLRVDDGESTATTFRIVRSRDEPEPTPSFTVEPSPEPTPGPTRSPAPSPTAEPTRTDGAGPGFGAAPAIVALVAGAVQVLRRR